MHKIQLSQGKYAIVDAQDFRNVIKHKWSLARKKHLRYAETNMKIGKVWRRIRLHRFIMNAKSGQIIDHENENGLDNRRCNLRFATNSQNLHNCSGHHDKKTSRYRGVSFHKMGRKFVAQLMVNRKYFYLGLFELEIEAAKAYDAAALKNFGEFAKLNFPVDSETGRGKLSAA